ncbi:MAG: tyrosine-protein phosphatase [Gammaproteobacteria bacterium]|nr:tyrosine-protein phosphatase [Gammaproteobacteria bacterium]MDH5273066.1 tyrosine-protein phosphatase [Gammaproteobacteria bacterium]
MAHVLESPGVRREAIVEDYTLTNAVVDLRAQLLGERGTGAGLAATAEPLLALSASAQEAMLAARPEYLLASLRAIEARYGSVRRYLLDGLALEPALLERLHERLLT